MNRQFGFSHAVLLILALVGRASAQEGAKLSIDQSIEIGLANSKILHASLMRSDAAEARAKQANTATLPSLKFGANYSRLSDVPPFVASIPAGAFGGGAPPQPISIPLSATILDNYNLRVSAVQPLFTGFRLSSSTEFAEKSALAVSEEHQRDRADLVYNITNAYWSLYKASESKRVIDETIDQVNAHLTDVKNLMAQGMATMNDVLRVEVQLSNAKLLQIDAVNNVHIATIGLNNVMGQNIGTTLDLTSRPDSVFADSGKSAMNDYDALVSRALERRPEYKSMKLRVEASEAAVTYAKSGWYPQLYLSGNYYYANPNQRYVPAEQTFHDSWDLNVTATFDIWNWGLTMFQTDEARSQLQLSKDVMGQLHDNISLEVAQSLFNVNQTKEKIKVSDQAVGQASENHRITNEKYKEGLVLNSDVVDAQFSLLLARTTYTQSLVDYELAVAKLRQSIGD